MDLAVSSGLGVVVLGGLDIGLSDRTASAFYRPPVSCEFWAWVVGGELNSGSCGWVANR